MDKQTFLTRYLLHNQSNSNNLRKTDKLLLTNNKNLKKAAVLIPIVKRNTGLNIILTERALHLRHHPGQISFPGGKYEQCDESLQHTALRETQEEIGISQNQISIIGSLTALPTVSGFIVYPYLGFVHNDHSLKIDKQEVRSLLEVPLDFLTNKNNYYLQHLTANKKRHYSYCIAYQNRMIWGATAQMLKNLQRQVTD